MFTKQINNFIDFESGLGIFYLNLIAYISILFLFFSVILVIGVQKIKTLNEFKFLNMSNFSLFSIIVILLSFAGMPPLFGFLGKFLVIIYLLKKSFFFFFFAFIFLNILMIFFYIQNIRFLITKTQKNQQTTVQFTSYESITKSIFIISFNFINFFSLFFLEDIYIFTINITMFSSL